ncbi:MAG TPA: hypothetical protein DDZ39_00575 [Flavobacteriaceae bacterium]|nr:hypothetical protein [Flavobacteriaceae bacterium]
MARVYYKNKKLIGKSIHHNAINPFVFENILDKANPLDNHSVRYEIEYGFPTFEKALVWNGDFWYTHKNQKIYLPKAIIFGDDFTVPFPSEYYFIVFIEGKIELRKVNGGKDILFIETLDISKEVTDPSIIDKVDNSMVALNKIINTTKAEKPISIQKPIPKGVLQSLKNLSLLCGWTQKEAENFIQYLSNKKLKEYAPYTLLTLSQNYCYTIKKGHKPLFMYFDWKEGVYEFKDQLEDILQNNFALNESASLGSFTEESQIFEDGVLEYFDRFLRARTLQLTCIDTGGDDYLFVVHKIENFQAVKKQIKSIGWDVSEI